MYGLIAHDALFADFLASGLELRLDKAHNPAFAAAKQGAQGREYQTERNKAHVDGREVERFRDFLSGQIPRVRAFKAYDALIRAELPGQLPVAHVHGVDFRGAAL